MTWHPPWQLITRLETAHTQIPSTGMSANLAPTSIFHLCKIYSFKVCAKYFHCFTVSQLRSYEI